MIEHITPASYIPPTEHSVSFCGGEFMGSDTPTQLLAEIPRAGQNAEFNTLQVVVNGADRDRFAEAAEYVAPVVHSKVWTGEFVAGQEAHRTDLTSVIFSGEAAQYALNISSSIAQADGAESSTFQSSEGDGSDMLGIDLLHGELTPAIPHGLFTHPNALVVTPEQASVQASDFELLLSEEGYLGPETSLSVSALREVARLHHLPHAKKIRSRLGRMVRRAVTV